MATEPPIVERPSDAARWARGGPRAVRRFWHSLGPGLITGAADDDPSGIATYSIAGARFGTSLLWMSVLTWPLMAAVQTMCARIGMVTGHGLAAALQQKFPRPVLLVMCVGLMIANTINIGADLAGMADAAELITGINSHLLVVVFGGLIAWATVQLRYAAFARILKWLALVLGVYIIAAIDLKPVWSSVLHDTFLPSGLDSREAWSTVVAILGTTISPYLFFWQASQEVEEEKAAGKVTEEARRGATAAQLRARKLDVGFGTFFSNLAMFFIILTTALTLHKAGITELATGAEVAKALEPLAGRFSSWLYAIGVIGTGALAIPTLAGSAAYAFAETLGWQQGMDEDFRRAEPFYAVIVVSLLIGVLLDFADVSPVKALYWTAVLNGVLAPFLLTAILMVAGNKAIMQGQPSSRLGMVTVGITTVVMFGAAIAMFVAR